MKNILVITLLFMQIFIAFGQDLKTKKKKVREQEGKATFYVLANNDTVKHGQYQIKAWSGSRILLKGIYVNNKKEGLWEEQYYGKVYKGPKAVGHYKNDIKTGEWIYFNYEGDTVQIYNWTDNRMVFLKLSGKNTKEYTIIEDGKEIKSKLDSPPTCVSGINYFLYELRRKLGDQTVLLKNVGNELYELRTKISITVDKNSSITEIAYSTDEKKELKEFIEKFIKTYKWIPGKKDRKDVTSKFEFSVNVSSQF